MIKLDTRNANCGGSETVDPSRREVLKQGGTALLSGLAFAFFGCREDKPQAVPRKGSLPEAGAVPTSGPAEQLARWVKFLNETDKGSQSNLFMAERNISFALEDLEDSGMKREVALAQAGFSEEALKQLRKDLEPYRLEQARRDLESRVTSKITKEFPKDGPDEYHPKVEKAVKDSKYLIELGQDYLVDVRNFRQIVPSDLSPHLADRTSELRGKLSRAIDGINKLLLVLSHDHGIGAEAAYQQLGTSEKEVRLLNNLGRAFRRDDMKDMIKILGEIEKAKT